MFGWLCGCGRGGATAVTAALDDLQEKSLVMLNKETEERQWKRCEYRVLSLFGAGSGLPACLGMLKGLVAHAIKESTQLQYLAWDGVSAGALIVCWMSHCNIADPREVATEIDYVVDMSHLALREGIISFPRHAWGLLCPAAYASVCDFDTFCEWMGRQMSVRRKLVIAQHRERRLQAQDHGKHYQLRYPLCRAQYYDCVNNTRHIVSYCESGVGVNWNTFKESCFASAAIPWVFQAQQVGYVNKSQDSKGLTQMGYDGCLAGMGVVPNPRFLELLSRDVCQQISGGDILCANPPEYVPHPLSRNEMLAARKRYVPSMDAAMPRLWAAYSKVRFDTRHVLRACNPAYRIGAMNPSTSPETAGRPCFLGRRHRSPHRVVCLRGWVECRGRRKNPR